MKGFFKVAFVVDVVVILSSFFVDSSYYLLNTQLAFIASLLVVLGSFWGYSKMVRKKARNFTGRDAIDNIEDPHELYEELLQSDGKSAKEIFEEERAKIKANRANMKNFIKSAPAFLSPSRLFGYLFLVLSVMVLIRKGYFEAGSFLIGLAIVPLSALLYAVLPIENR